MAVFNVLPAGEFPLAEAQLQAVLSGASHLGLLDVAAEPVALHAVEAPGSLARLHAQAALLCVDGEHGELRFTQCS